MDFQELAKDIPVEGEVTLEGIDFITNGDQYLTFCLGQEHYGINILRVKEIRGWESPTLLPNSPDYVKGVINIRGMIIPIMDLRIRFNMNSVNYSPTTVVIVLTIGDNENSRTMGFVVDAVSDVINAEPEDTQKAPAIDSNVPFELINGLVNIQDHVVTLLNVEQLITVEGETND